MKRSKEWWDALDKRIRRFLITCITILIAYGAYHLWMYQLHLTSGTESSVFYGLMKATAGVSYLRIVDDFVYYKIDTEKLLSEDPKAYAIYILAYAVVIARAFGV